MPPTLRIGLFLAALWLLVGLAWASPLKPVTAVVPTPTPATPSSEPGCRLDADEDCPVVTNLDLARQNVAARYRTHPAVGAQSVPTYTLISATFNRPMQPASFTPDTFYVTDEHSRLAGLVSYLEASRLAIFEPQMPLRPGTVYTATILAQVRDQLGLPLAQSRVWTFTTIAAAPGLSAAGRPGPGGMNIYFGDLHGHTGYSDGQGTPAQAYLTGRANGLDFMALTEHCFMLTQDEWTDLKNQATSATIPGQFVALPGFEYTNLYGHLNVFGSDTYVQRDNPNYDTLAEFYEWLIAHPTAFAQFNHPKKDAVYDWNFHDFAYNPQADLKIVLQELESTGQFLLSLNQGWHLGTLKNRDTHIANWGCCPLMGAVAPNLTPAAILEALRSRRTFFVSPNDSNLALVMQANGYWMGSAIPAISSIQFTLTAYDPDPPGKPLRLALYDNGVRAASVSLSSRTVYSWSPIVSGQLGHYYYAEAYYDGWYYPAYSSPIWVERPPLAEAGPTQIVAPGMLVSLDGRASGDADGDALAFSWGQDSGPTISLNNPGSAQPTFMAPATLGNAILRLTVTDPGGLSAADTTIVTITNAPVLGISKTGPITAAPGEPITYTLTVTNYGITPANNVVITDVLPVGAAYVSGGDSFDGQVVSWAVPTLPANNGAIQVSFVVIANQSLANFDYRATCPGCIPAKGSVTIFTNGRKLYLPLIHK